MSLRIAKYLTPLSLLFLLPGIGSAEAAAQCETLLAPLSEFDRFMDEQAKIPLPEGFGLPYVDIDFLLNHAAATGGGTGLSGPMGSGKPWNMNLTVRDGLFIASFRHPDVDIEQRASLLFLSFLRHGGQKLSPKTMGVVFHVEAVGRPRAVYTVLDFTRQSAGHEKLFKPWKNLARDYRKLVAQEYKNRLHLPQEAIDELIRVSEELESRSIILTKTSESPVRFRPDQNEVFFPSTSPYARGGTDPFFAPLSENLTVQRGATLVLSRGEEEKLPLEIVTGLSIPRRPGETLAEIGRLAAKKGSMQNTTPRDAQQMAAIALGASVDRLVIQVDGVHRRLFEKYGFKALTSTSFANEEYSVLEIRTTEFLSMIIRNEFPEDSLDLVSSELISKHDQGLRGLRKK